MDIGDRGQSATWRWSLLFSVVFLNICLPNLVLSYGAFWVQLSHFEVPLWLGLVTPSVFILTFSLTQCWFREAADSWGGSVGYRVMAGLGLSMVVASLLVCAFIPYKLQPFIYGVLGGMGSSLISAQVDAVIFETYDTRLGIIRGICFAGQAVGISLFPHLISVLIEYFGFSFAHIVLSGIMLQALPAILLLKVDESHRRPVSFSRYKDTSETYMVYRNDAMDNYYSTELQLHDMGKKCWKSPSDDNLHREEGLDDEENDTGTITPPPSPEEKRRNLFGVDILPEIPEESEESDVDEKDIDENNVNKNKKRLDVAIKRLSVIGDNFDEYISKQVRKDSHGDNDTSNYREVEVTYDHISPQTDIQTEKLMDSFSFRCHSTYVSFKRKLCIPSYRIYRIRRRALYLMYNINDTFIKPLTRSLSCWEFYPALLLSFAKQCLTAVFLTLIPMIALQVRPKISLFETNFLMSLLGFTWICFLLCTPWLAQTPKRNFKYVAVLGLIISIAACIVLGEANNHDLLSIGCVVAGLGYGAVSSCSETAVQDFIGARKWPKIHSPLEILSAVLLVLFMTGLSFLTTQGGLQYLMLILAVTLSIVTLVWIIIAAVSIYTTKVRSLRLGRNWLL
ncbi:uncharacterized protein [Epargyreus clarus]|uniref:uncharacterized protein isoform X2 n=1 Tax=Epargyreus clarus TaxID=520877 RepID=UPI003C2B1B82